MNYGPTSIRYDIGSHVRLRVSQHFGLPGNMRQDEIVEFFLSSFWPTGDTEGYFQVSAVTWLMSNRRYHEGSVDIEVSASSFLLLSLILVSLN